MLHVCISTPQFSYCMSKVYQFIHIQLNQFKLIQLLSGIFQGDTIYKLQSICVYLFWFPIFREVWLILKFSHVTQCFPALYYSCTLFLFVSYVVIFIVDFTSWSLLNVRCGTYLSFTVYVTYGLVTSSQSVVPDIGVKLTPSRNLFSSTSGMYVILAD